MTGSGGDERRFNGLSVTHLAHQYYVRILPQRRAQRFAEAGSIHFHLALHKEAELIAVQKFKRIFDGDDVLRTGGIDEIHDSSKCRALAAAGSARHQYQAATFFANTVND